MHRLFGIVFTVFFAGSALAQDKDLLDAARAYVATDVQQTQLNNALPVDGLLSQLDTRGENLDPAQLQELKDTVKAEMTTLRETMESTMVEQLTKSFTVAELNALIAFYETADGASATLKLPLFVAATQQQMQPAYQTTQQNIQRSILEVMGDQ